MLTLGRVWLAIVKALALVCAVSIIVAALLPGWRLPIVVFLSALIALIAVIFVLWQVPKWQVASAHLVGTEAAKLENDARQTLAQALGGLFVLVGLAATWLTVLSTYKSLEISERGQITERFGRAVELLGKPERQVRAGGIYALEQIARDSPKLYHQSVMEVVTAHIRDVASWKERKGLEKPPADIELAPVDIQAAITVIARRDINKDNPDQPLNLRYADLRKVVLTGLKFRLAHVSFIGAHMEWARLRRVDMNEAMLDEVHFEDARLEGTNLKNALLEGAFLDRARLENTHLEGACLLKASLKGAHLEGANLMGVIGLTKEQIDSSHKDSFTQFQILPTSAKEITGEVPSKSDRRIDRRLTQQRGSM
jgi:pentapeptide repeat protein